MKVISLNNDLKIEIPNSWEAKIDRSIISLFDPINGVGALQFSSYSVLEISSIGLVEELNDYLEDKYQNITVNLINDYAYCNITDKTDRYWRYWLLKENNSILLISYNCELSDKDKEYIIIDEIIKSIS